MHGIIFEYRKNNDRKIAAFVTVPTVPDGLSTTLIENQLKQGRPDLPKSLSLRGI